MTGLERLWAGWRAAYIEGVVAGTARRDGCLFEALADGDPDEMLVLARDEHVFAVMNAYPYTSGHLMVAPLRHVGTLADLDPMEAAALMEMTRTATVALDVAFHPQGVNIGANVGRAAGAGIPDHLHLHVVPRWHGDTNFMTAVAEARVLPESLAASYAKLRRAWPGR